MGVVVVVTLLVVSFLSYKAGYAAATDRALAGIGKLQAEVMNIVSTHFQIFEENLNRMQIDRKKSEIQDLIKRQFENLGEFSRN